MVAVNSQLQRCVKILTAIFKAGGYEVQQNNNELICKAYSKLSSNVPHVTSSLHHQAGVVSFKRFHAHVWVEGVSLSFLGRLFYITASDTAKALVLCTQA